MPKKKRITKIKAKSAESPNPTAMITDTSRSPRRSRLNSAKRRSSLTRLRVRRCRKTKRTAGA